MKRWLIHRNKKPVNSDWADSASWLTFDAALARLDQGSGLGFLTTGGVTVDGHTLLVFDLDACRDPLTGTVEPWAMQVVENCGRGYTEITPSGKGLRVFVLVQSPPEFWAPKTFRRGLTRAPNTEGKRLECQVFGTDDKCGHVTITGDRLDNTSEEVARIANLDWWEGVFGQAPDSGVGADGALLELPEGYGPEPSMTEVKAHVSRDQRLKTVVVDGDWKALYSDPKEHSSSDAYMVVVREVLKAANGHGKAAVKFLLTETAWGMERVDSQNREKYGRRDHVEGEVKRIAGKAPVFVFTPLPDEPTASTPGAAAAVPTTKEINTDGLLLPADEFVRRAGKQLFLVKHTIARVGVTQFFGDPSCGKTPFVMSLAIALATGQERWFGKKVERHGLVVYMVGEDPDGVAARLTAECKSRGLEMAEVAKNLVLSTRAGRLTEREDAQRWLLAIQRAAAGREVVAIVVDTQAQNFGPGNENAPEDMAAFTHHLEELCALLRTAVLTTHHPGHDNKGRGRGHSSMDGFLNSRFEVVKTKREDGTVIATAHDKKHKNWAEQLPLVGVLTPVVCYQDDDGEDVTAVTLREEGANLFENEDAVVKMLAAIRDGGTEAGERALAERAGVTRHEARRLLDLVVGRGFAERLGALEAKLGGKSGRSFGKMRYVLTALGVEALGVGGKRVVEQVSTSRVFDEVVDGASTSRNQLFEGID